MAKQPVLERLLLHDETFEEIALIESGRFGRRGGSCLRSSFLELMYVDRHCRGIKRDGFTVYEKGLRVDVAQTLPERVQRLTQAGPSRRLQRIPPQETGQLVSRVGRAKRHREVGQKSLRLAGGKGNRCARVEAGPKAAQECQNQLPHRARAFFRAHDTTPSSARGATFHACFYESLTGCHVQEMSDAPDF